MTKIRTAEEVLIEVMRNNQLSSNKHVSIIQAMQEYAKQFIDLAAEEARTRINDESTSIIVDKESILKLKERVV